MKRLLCLLLIFSSLAACSGVDKNGASSFQTPPSSESASLPTLSGVEDEEEGGRIPDPSIPYLPTTPIDLYLYEPEHDAYVSLEQPAGSAGCVSDLITQVGWGLGLTPVILSTEQRGDTLVIEWDASFYRSLSDREADRLLQSAAMTLQKTGFADCTWMFVVDGRAIPFEPTPYRPLKLDMSEVEGYLDQIEYGGMRDNLAERYPIVYTLQPDLDPEWIRLLCCTTPRREGEDWESYKLRTALRYTPLYSTTVGGEDPPPTPLLYLAGAAGLDGDLLIAREADRVAGTLFGESLRHRDVDRYTYRESWGLYTGWGASGEVWLPYILETREEGELLTVRLCYLPAFIGETVEIFDGEGNPWPLEDAAALATRRPRYRATLRKTDAGYQLKGLEDE